MYTVHGDRVSFVMLINHANARQSEPAQRALLEWVHAGMGRTLPSASAPGVQP